MSEEEEVKVDVETPSAKEDKADDKKADDAAESHHIKIQTRLTSEQKAYFGIMMAAIVQLISIGVMDQSTLGALWTYGIALGVVSLIFAAIGLAMGAMKTLEGNVKILNSYFLFFWTFVGACFMTFGTGAPFQSTGNGYFASWGMALFSVMAVGVSFDEVRHTTTGMGPRLGLFVSSLIVLIASASYLGDGKRLNDATSYNVAIFAVALSSVTVLVIASLIYCGVRRNDDANPNPVVFFVVLVFCICWIFEAFYSTFHGPFNETSNGYFGSWGAAFSSLFATIAGTKRMLEPRKEPAREAEEEDE
mmetsp:Transcript_22963/g.33891  ORF Transcript_22963/g.33891 Transcript_22963/m.33891 type:complete len:305 (-) Transcript_22963:106-1020(-)|eukprot:CAMPEP_0194200190 /NCGR_PEP_ID=MMETSP0156-20130528/906_1 /TAXON_ID=33649 /ORGANISM="Thalassionema nitzschioides, Strain L26-B" /LENGTH=304 /DNA_ID=CAMNT_0038925157 /DNA_START=68 /DNA_END=982 /DNA_ORIENTATION=+